MKRREFLATVLMAPVGVVGRHTFDQSVDELTSLGARQALEWLRSRRVSPTELVDAHLARIARVDPEIGAFITVTADRARADAERPPNTPLAGLPIAHKDLFETAGILTTAGSRLFARHVPADDAALVRTLSRAGTVLLGKTNTHELGAGVTTINPFFGTTRNPVDTSRIPGGSSGGSAAAVAARLSVVATGSDTGGSVRIPAALCGCVGFKPTFGRLDTRGLLGACPTFDHAGLVARSVEDVALVYAAITTGQTAFAPRPARPFRVGVAQSYFSRALSDDVGRAMEEALDRFRRIGASVVTRDLPVDDQTMSRVFDPIVVSEIEARYGAAWRARPEAFSPEFAAVFKAPPPPPEDVDRARRALAAFQEEVHASFEGVDVIVTPTVPVTAPPIAGPIDAGLILRNTWPFNAARTPAMSIPCGRDRQGLPVALQVAARRGADDLVLEVGRAFEGN